jgi:hypothetical protein
VVDGVYILMTKQDESATGVRYRAAIDVAGEAYLSGSGKPRHHLVKKHAVFEFHFATEEIVFVPELSDAEFLENVRYRMPCLMKMRKCQREGQFPETVEWAS